MTPELFRASHSHNSGVINEGLEAGRTVMGQVCDRS